MSDEQCLEVVRTHLELSSPEKLRAAPRPDIDAHIVALDEPTPAEYLELYSRIGGPWQWRDRLAWTESETRAYLTADDVHVFTLDVNGERAGFFELKEHAPDVAEIMYFGLDRRFLGRGLGGWMLTRAVEEAFARGAQRVILNTCTLDAPQALPNYLARGFVITRVETYRVPLESAGPTAAGTSPTGPSSP